MGAEARCSGQQTALFGCTAGCAALAALFGMLFLRPPTLVAQLGASRTAQLRSSTFSVLGKICTAGCAARYSARSASRPGCPACLRSDAGCASLVALHWMRFAGCASLAAGPASSLAHRGETACARGEQLSRRGHPLAARVPARSWLDG